MTEVFEIRKADDRRDVIHRACEVLTEGGLIACPTETLYVAAASALNAEGVSRLAACGSGAPCVLLVKSLEEACDYTTDLPQVARKLARRCWPGPLTMMFPHGILSGLFAALPEATQRAVRDAEDHVGLRVSGNEVLASIQQLMPAPLVITAEEPGLRSSAEALAKFGDRLQLLIDDGPSRYGEPATVVQIGDGTWEIVEPGVVSARAIHRLASEVYLFVCTGNTCRSPMAEALFRRRLAERLGCGEEELIERGHLVISAGLRAIVGAAASPEAAELLAAEGIDLSGHESQPLTERLLNHSDHVFTMTRDHRAAILSERPDLEQTVHLLSLDGSDIPDPIGGGRDEYQSCRIEIERSVSAVLDRLFPTTSRLS